MNPGMFSFWHMMRRAGWGPAGCGPASHGDGYGPASHGEGDDGDFAGGAFGVRRPLRFLSFKLQLSEEQVGQFAAILSDLKTERAQAAVDNRRTVTAFADALAGDKLDEARLGEAGGLRVASAERLRDAVLKALGRMHALLEPRQRAQLAYLIRSGALTI